MHKAKRIYLDGNGPFSGINTFTTTISMANYFQKTGRSEVADALMEDLFNKEEKEEISDGKGRETKEKKEVPEV